MLAALLATGSAAGQDLSRADPVLRYLLRTRPLPAAQPGTADLLAGAPPFVSGALVRADGELWVRTLVRVGPGGEAALRRAGARIGVRAGDVLTARVPFAAVNALLSEPGIRAMDAATPLTLLGVPALRSAGGPTGGPAAGVPAALDADSALVNAGFFGLRRRAGSTWEGLAGQGVVIGVVDSGLDLTHDDFLDAAGNTRVVFAWDQTDSSGAAPGTVGPHNLDFGTECTAATIDQGGCPMVDGVGHGTHVTGTAAGDGSATGQGRPAWRFPGGAPAADIIVVKAGEGSATADAVLAGVAYVFARAQALGRPAVVNLSLAGAAGPHDGSTVLEQGLDALVGPGRIIVAGAGNEGDFRNTFPVRVNGPRHAQGTGGGSHGVRLPPYSPLPGTDGVGLELWYDGADSLSITLTSPRGDVITATTGDTASLETAGGGMAIDNALGGANQNNGDHGAFIAIGETLGGVLPDTGVWQIDVAADALHASGVYHLWVAIPVLNSAEPPTLSGGTTNRYLVTVPASADRVIAAGAHVTRHQWSGVGGDVASWLEQEPLGDIAYFSSPGPRRDGGQKPALTGPGKIVISSLGKDATLWDPEANQPLIEADSVHVGLLGTSVSAPLAAAAAALLLQVDPELTPEEVRDALRLSAATDAFVGTPIPNPVWGAGKLDAAAAVERLRPDGLATAEAVNLSANPVRGDALVINYRELPESVAIYTLIGERVRGFTDRELGPLNVIWPLDTDAGGDVANGAYVLVVELQGWRVVRKLFVARP